MSSTESLIVVGRLGRPHGVRGWLHLNTHTTPEDNIFTYQPWFVAGAAQDDPAPVVVEDTKVSGHKLWVKLEGLDTREDAALWVNREILAPRSVLPEPDDGQYYWSDLEGLTVVDTEGKSLGVIDYLFNAGASDVMCLQQEDKKTTMVPYIPEVVVKVDLDAGRMVVDWQEI